MAGVADSFFDLVCQALSPRCNGEVRTVRTLGAPFGPQSFERWVAAGLLTTSESAALLALSHGRQVGAETISRVLQPESRRRRGKDDWGWGFDGERRGPDNQAQVAAVARAVFGKEPARREATGGRRPDSDAPADSWGWDADGQSSAIFESLLGDEVDLGEHRVRFDVQERIGRTRLFDVHHARDLLMGRDVAVHMHRPDSPLTARQFVRGVRMMGSLQHPQIEPVYELDHTTDGAPFWATSQTLPHTLDKIIKQVAQDDGRARERWTLTVRLEALLDVARGVAFAHRAGVVHRDLRPSRIRIGDFGETLISGWFRARRKAEAPDEGLDATLSLVSGGLAYLAPERLEHGLIAAGLPADIWGLGALLYAILSRRPPFSGTSRQVMEAIRGGQLQTPSKRSASGREVPAALESLCMQALAIEPERRRVSADEFVSEIEEYLDGTRTEERRLEQAEERFEDAQKFAGRYGAAREALHAAWQAEARTRDPAVESEAREAFEARTALDSAVHEAEHAFYAAEEAYMRVLTVMPAFEPVHYGLCALHFRVLQDVERGWMRVPRHALRASIRQLDPGGFTDALAASARLELRTRPAGIAATFHQYRSRGGRIMPDKGRPIGKTPFAFEDVRPGNYLLVLADQGRQYALPISLAPGEHLTLSFRMPERLPGDCVFVPGGPCRVGADGDDAALVGALPARRSSVPGFFIARTPVTMAEYGHFLNARWRRDPEAAARLAPRVFPEAPPMWAAGDQGYTLPFEGRDGHTWTAEHPVVGLTRNAVEAYLEWRSKRDGLDWRLPTELEWEKAGRSAEGRVYPWGDRPEAAFCHHRPADGAPARPTPVGSIEADTSVYGVQDLAGGVQEYAAAGVGERWVLRGGGWSGPFAECRLVTRVERFDTLALTAVGFRLALDGPDGPPPRPAVFEALPEWLVPEAPVAPSRKGEADSELVSAELTVEGRSLLMSAGLPPPLHADDEDPADSFDIGPDRYTMLDEIARGSMGKVMMAYDRVLQRHVALKLLHDKHRGDKLSRYRFMMEARITGRLQHPTMVPVYDMGVLRNGQRFFAMKVIEGQSLQDVLRARSAGDHRSLSDFNRDRLLTVMRRVCQGVAFAHERRIVHRDLKPANILLGEYGEVCVVDLGLARQIEPDPSDMIDVQEAKELARADGRVTRVGSVIGTPYYMSPEQAMGLQDLVDDASDVYGLGAILYHVLTHRPPFGGRKVNEVLAKVRKGNARPPSQVAPDQDIAPELDRIVLKSLSMDPRDRQKSALELAGELAAYQARDRMAEKTREIARQRAARAAKTFALVEKEQTRLEQMRARLRAMREDASFAPGAASGERELRIAHQQEKIRLQEEHIEAHIALVVRQSRLASDSGTLPIRDRLFALLKARYQRAERNRASGMLAWYGHLVRQVDADGSLARWRNRGVSLTVASRPQELQVALQRVVERQRRLEPGSIVQQGRTPLTVPDVPIGGGLATFTRHRVSLRVPFFVMRDRAADFEVEWPEATHDGFACIPGGRFLYGGDPLSDEGQPARSARIGTFHISIHPVTCGEYNTWLTELSRTARQRSSRMPIIDREGLPLWGPEGQARFGRYDPQRPVTGITLADAHAYAQWRSRRDGIKYRLPTSAEWEKAARGVDGRAWPWGDRFEPSYCLGDRPGIFPVGRFPHDVSPYGVRDLVTGVAEWTLTAARDDPNACYVRGGCSARALTTRPCTARLTRDPRRPSPYVGFRLVIPGR